MNETRTILIIDDKLDNLRVLGEMLELEGFNVRPALSGEIALRAVEAIAPDLILLDIHMPGIDGYETCRRLKANDNTREIPVVFISAMQDLENKLEAFKSGGVDYIVKPFHEQEVLSRVRIHIQLSHMTELKREIEERNRAEETLRQNEAKQSAMIANIADVITIIDQGGFYRYKSPNIEKWFGWRPEEVIGTNTRDNIHPDDFEHTQVFFNKLLKEQYSKETIECRYKCKDGSYKWIEFTGVNLLHDPNIKGVLGNYHDIDKRKKAEEEKENLEKQFYQAQKIESIGRLAGGVAHDFNNMLSVILGNAELALGIIDPDQSVHDELLEIKNAAERSANLTRQLLAFARKQAITPKVLDLNDTVEGMLKMLQRLIGENIDCAWIPGSEVWPIKIDPSQVDQILANLCVNARDAISSSVGKVTIETGTAIFDEAYCGDHYGFSPGEYVKLSVSDDGCGMDNETMSHIFEPFFTTKDIKVGTGLGLAMVYGVVKQNNGFINIYSETGLGTRFTIYLPRYTGATMTEKSISTDEPIKMGQETILIVEDELNILKMVTKMLNNQGYYVISASTPYEAIQLARDFTGDIHLLITDVVMPNMNGRDLAKTIICLHPELKHLFMSGYTANVIVHQGILDEDVHFIQKPFSTKDLSLKVREALKS